MSSFSFTFNSPTNPWIITHALNDEHVFWVLYDDAGEFILPTSAVATSANVFTFTFDEAITGSGRILSILDLVSLGSSAAFADLATVKQCPTVRVAASSKANSSLRALSDVDGPLPCPTRRDGGAADGVHLVVAAAPGLDRDDLGVHGEGRESSRGSRRPWRSCRLAPGSRGSRAPPCPPRGARRRRSRRSA